MTSENLDWHIFVYLSYFIVGISLISYSVYSYFIRKKSIESLSREGFLDQEETQNGSENH